MHFDVTTPLVKKQQRKARRLFSAANKNNHSSAIAKANAAAISNGHPNRKGGFSMYEALLKATQEYQKIAASFAKPGPAALFGLPPAGRALLYAALQKDLGRVLCIVTPGEAEATHFADDLKALGLAAAVFPPRDFMLRPVEGAGREYEYRRLSVLGALAGGRLQAVCVPAEALLQYTVPRDKFLKNTLTLKPGMVYNREALVARLFAAGYVRRSQVDGPGQFSVRGDIVDIYAPDMRQPARVEYWDDEIDSMASFDLLTQRRDGALEKIYLSPAREVLFAALGNSGDLDELVINLVYNSCSQDDLHLSLCEEYTLHTVDVLYIFLVCLVIIRNDQTKSCCTVCCGNYVCFLSYMIIDFLCGLSVIHVRPPFLLLSFLRAVDSFCFPFFCKTDFFGSAVSVLSVFPEVNDF